jgi:Skp family chaperone for outer membrane proteins
MPLLEYLGEAKVRKIGAAVLGIAAIGVSVYFLVRVARRQGDGIADSFDKSKGGDDRKGKESYDKKFVRVRNQLRTLLDSNKNQLTPEVITAVIKAQYDLANQDMKTILLQSRKERRAELNDLPRYAELVAKNQEEQEDLQEKHLGAILSWFNISKQAWSTAEQQWQSGRFDGSTYSQLIDIEEKKLMQSYHSQKSEALPFSTIQEILNFKIKKLGELK